MASSLKFISFFFIFFFIIFNQIHARDSQLFSKFNKDNNDIKSQDRNPKSKILVTTRETEQEDQDPSFVRETGNAYGLYGHELDQIPPDTSSNNSNDNEDVKEMHRSYRDTRLFKSQESDSFENAPEKDENVGHSNYYYYKSDAYGNRENAFDHNNNVAVKQGMSDTRFLDNGKYFYHVENENKNKNNYRNPNRYYKNGSSRNYRYSNNNAAYNSYNSDDMEGSRNQEFEP